jgi:hypothetical protein
MNPALRSLPGCALLLFVTLLLSHGSSAPTAGPSELHTDGINLVLGDRALVEAYGWPLPADLEEDARIRTHLRYVERLLRERSVEGLPAEARDARLRSLERLSDYIRRGEFPRNDDHPDARRPTFIDSRGHICAVGYLLEQDLGREAAEAIAARYKYAFIREIDSPLLARWAATTGLSREELELIQPTYPSYYPNRDHAPLFATLDRFDGRSHASLTTGLHFDGQGDGVPARFDLSFYRIRADGLSGMGFYGAASLTRRMGGASAASAMSNFDLGVTYVRQASRLGWFVLRGGLLLPLADTNAVAVAINRSVAPQRLADAVLFQPGALGGRVSTSVILFPGTHGYHEEGGEGVFARFDAGLDAYAPSHQGLQWSPRWGAGLGYRWMPFAATLELTGNKYRREASSESELHHALGGSLRYISDERFSFQPGLTFATGLSGAQRGVFVGLDLAIRWGVGLAEGHW